MTPSEAARHASLVRWKKEQPFAASVADRLAQIRAARVKKAKGKGGKGKGKKGKAAAKPKDARTPQEKANQNRGAIAKETGMGDLEGTIVRLGAGMHSDVEKDAHEKLIGAGLAKRDVNGVVSLTPTGKKWRRAADKGDADSARAALDEGKAKATESAAKQKVKAERLAKQKQRKAKRKKAKPKKATKDMAMSELDPIFAEIQTTVNALAGAATKAGRRNASKDQAQIDQGYELSMQLCDLFEALGADTGEEEGEVAKDEAAGLAEEAGEAKALGETVYGSAIKALDGGAIGGFAVLFGTTDTPDMSPQRDYFTKATDYWLDRFGWPRPMTYHHSMDEDTADEPIVGTWTKAVVKDEGIWLEGQLDRAHRYHGAIKELIRRGYLKLSSDSAPQWVRREPQANGTNEVKRWPLISASPTVTPAEPRLSGISSLKALMAELGLDDTDNPEATPDDDRERLDAAKASDERARRLLLRTRFLTLQE
jgi:hypothetical protein